ncbi:SpoVT / AbrB like domain protein [compost metagenome]
MNLKVDRNGQVSIPKPVMDLLDIKPGTEVSFRQADDGSIIFDRADHALPHGRFARLRGNAGRGLSTEQIMALTRGDE